ncbi:MAG: hypothetical protein LBC53_06450 [Spirochaetaceae bacterium]|nr:hypothetical protein [Spirochaetaceae bacterium]
MKKRLPFAISLFAFLPLFISPEKTGAPLLAAEEKPRQSVIINFEPFEVEGMSGEEGLVIENLIRDYIKKINNVLLVFPGVEEFSAENGADYNLRGRIYEENSSYILQLKVKDVKRGWENALTSSYRTSSDMALKVPAINYSLLLGEESGLTVENDENKRINIEHILGRWKGDLGLEQVFFLRGGEGRAYFSSGAGMEFSYHIDGSKIIALQKSRNDPRYYPHHTPAEADALSLFAEPKRWELSLYNKGQILKGFLFETAFETDGEEIKPAGVSIKASEWIRK